MGEAATRSARLRPRGQETRSEARIDFLICSMDLRVRSRAGLTRQGLLHGGLEVRKRPCSHRRQQGRAIRPTLFAIYRRHGKTKHVGLQLANELALRAAARQEQVVRCQSELLENGEGVAQREA